MLLDQGAPLVGNLRGAARVAVAGYVAGGRAALAAITGAGYDVLRATRKPRRGRLAQGGADGLCGWEVMRMDVPAAYRHCEEVTRSQARNFSYGIRLLPPRQAARAVRRLRVRPADRRHRGRHAAPGRQADRAGQARASDHWPRHGGRPGRAASLRGPRDPAKPIRCWWPWPTRASRFPDPAGRVRRADRRVRGRRAGHQLRHLRRPARITAAAWRARSGGCRSACSAPGTWPRPRRWPTRSAWPCS